MGYLAKEISEVDATDPENIRIVSQVDRRVVTLLLGDGNYAQRYQNFLNHYPEIRKALARGEGLRPAVGWPHHGEGIEGPMAVKPIYAAGLDAGSRQTRLVICVLENGRIRFARGGRRRVAGMGRRAASPISRRSANPSPPRCARPKPRRRVRSQSVVVGMGGPTVRGANGRGVLELGYVQEIQQTDVNRVIDRASRVQLMEDRMVLQLFPQDFVVDDHPGHRDPRKMLASRLEINVHLVTASMQEHNAIIGAVNAAHLAVEETVFEALAACYAAVLPENRREGIAVVDIGAQSTELVVYYGDAMHLASTVRICGDHFTRDLAQGLCLSFEDAELVKMEFGCAVSKATARRMSWWSCPRRRTASRAKRSARSSTAFWKRAPRSCSASCAANSPASAWTAR